MLSGRLFADAKQAFTAQYNNLQADCAGYSQAAAVIVSNCDKRSPLRSQLQCRILS
jgi:hypothetical protein